MSDAALDAAVKQAKVTSGGMDISKEQIQQMVAASGCSLTLNSDGTYQMAVGPAQYTGKWDLAASTVTMAIETLQGVTVEQFIAQYKVEQATADQLKQPFKLNLDKEGKQLTGTAPGDPQTSLAFDKNEATQS